jgi:transcriptional regulator with XRE-family HTH domain
MIGDRIKAEREARGWSQSELARRSKVSQAFISQLENGDRQELGMKVAQKLATAFSMDLNVFTSAIDISTPPEELFRAAGWTASTIAGLVAAWDRQTPEFRLEVITQAQQRVEAAQREEDRLRALLRSATQVI